MNYKFHDYQITKERWLLLSIKMFNMKIRATGLKLFLFIHKTMLTRLDPNEGLVTLRF